jgi:hypothetical protein
MRRGGRTSAGAALAVALAAAPLGAQDATPHLAGTGPSAAAPATSLESYLVQPGRLVVERTHALPPIALEGGARLALEAVVAYEPAREQERVLGVRARLAGAGAAELAYLDLHEVEDLARTLTALPGVLESERAGKSPVEIRYWTRDGFGVAIGAGASPARPVIRFAGPPLREVPISDPALTELRAQLDASRRFLFGE